MKLYHGTSIRKLKEIRARGLRTRTSSGRATNWSNNPSHRGAVYLTNSYACFYANAACKGKEKWLILEIDTDHPAMFPHGFGPDEDFIEQVGRPNKDGIPGNMRERTKRIRARLHENWGGTLDHPPVAMSLQHLGNCTYFGNIPSAAITRIATVDPGVAKQFAYSCFDPCIVLDNYRWCGPKYRNSLKWLFNEPLEHDPLAVAM